MREHEGAPREHRGSTEGVPERAKRRSIKEPKLAALYPAIAAILNIYQHYCLAQSGIAPYCLESVRLILILNCH